MVAEGGGGLEVSRSALSGTVIGVGKAKGALFTGVGGIDTTEGVDVLDVGGDEGSVTHILCI